MIARSLSILVLSVSLAVAQDAPAPPPLVGVRDIEARLADLETGDALGHFELAEEIALEEPDDAGVELARTLYVLAFDRSRDADGNPRLLRSVCLALADLEQQGSERSRWLTAVASLESPVAPPSRDDADARETVALALGAYRAEDYLKARTQLNRPRAARLIDALDGDGARLMQEVVEEIGSDTACEVCRNKRTVRDRDSARARRERLCPRCQGNPGPRLRDDEYRELLVFEVNLLGARPRSWAAQLDLDQGAPLREADPDQLPRLFGVDVTKTRYVIPDGGSWRDGVWEQPAPNAGG